MRLGNVSAPCRLKNVNGNLSDGRKLMPDEKVNLHKKMKGIRYWRYENKNPFL